MPVPQSLSEPPEEPNSGATLRRRDSVLSRLPSLQGAGYTAEVRPSLECGSFSLTAPIGVAERLFRL